MCGNLKLKGCGKRNESSDCDSICCDVDNLMLILKRENEAIVLSSWERKP